MKATVKEPELTAPKPEISDGNQETLMKNRRIFAKPPIGQVIVASGMRIYANNRRMDWVLIKVPGKACGNHPPPYTTGSFEKTNLSNKSTPEDEYKKITEDSIIRQFGNMSPEMWVVKHGRTTKTTFGTVNRMSRTVHWGPDAREFVSESQEVEVFGQGDAFAYHGDSGSFVCDMSGGLVGLLIAMDLSIGEYGCGYVTPIRDLQGDVKKMTGGFVTLDLCR